MAKISQPGEGRSSTDGRIDSRTPSFNLGGASSINQQTKAFGKEVEKIGEEYFKIADRSIKESYYNDAMSTATLELNKRYQDRLSQPVDKNGNPNFGSLDKDVQKIAEDIKNELGFKLIDPLVKQKFDLNFNNMVTNKRLQAQGQARKQHLQYAQSSLNNALNSYVEGAGADEIDNLNQYSNQINSTIEDAVQSGVLDREQADKLKSKYQDSIRVAANQKLINQNPKNAVKIVAQETGISKEEKKKLEQIAKAAVKDEQRLIKTQTSDIQRKVKQQQEETAANLEIGILKGTIGEKDIETAANSNMDINELIKSLHPEVANKLVEENPYNITQNQRVSLITKALKKQEQIDKQAAKDIQISEDINSGKILTEKHKQSDIDALIRTRANQKAGIDEQGNQIEPSLLDIAQISRDIKAPSTEVSKSISSRIQYGSPDQLEEAIESYTMLQKYNPISLDKLNPKDEAALNLAKELIIKGGVKPSDAVEKARNAVYFKDNTETAKREQEYKTIEDFKQKNIKDTIEKAFNTDGDWLSLIGFGQESFEFEDGVESFIERDLKEIYINGTGDQNSTLETMKRRLSTTHNVSKINGNNQFSYLPVEAVYGNFISKQESVEEGTQKIRNHLEKTYEKLLPEGIDTSSLRVHADDLSRIPGKPISYGVYYQDKEGGLTPLVLPNQSSQERWAFDEGESLITEIYKKREMLVELRNEVMNPKEIAEIDARINKFDLGIKQLQEDR